MSFGYVSFGVLSLGLMSFGVMSFGLLSVYLKDRQPVRKLNKKIDNQSKQKGTYRPKDRQ